MIRIILSIIFVIICVALSAIILLQEGKSQGLGSIGGMADTYWGKNKGRSMSQDEKIGYIADYPIYGNIANINAFALGARMINPYAKVYLEWSRVRDREPQAEFGKEGITFISGDDMITPQTPSREYGLYQKNPDGRLKNLATPIWHWGKFYERIVNIICRGDFDRKEMKGKQAINYWWGMSADVIDVICSKNLPHGTSRLIAFLRNSIRAGSFQPFEGIIYSQDGKIQCKENASLTPEEITTMKEGLLEIFIESGAVVSTPTCGPCLGGYMGILAAGERCISTTNRNFVGRMGHVDSEVYLSSPAVAAASAITGHISAPDELGL